MRGAGGRAAAARVTAHAAARAAAPGPDAAPEGLHRLILAASLGTLFEWYDFYLYGSLAVFFGELFFPVGNERAALLASLAAFGAGFGVRPLGALVFGRIGDRIGRKYSFLATLLAMGFSTALIGLLPTYASIGIAAPVLLVSLRLIQGLAVGGEYGGAAIYVAEHLPHGRRGWGTSWIQTTATLGFFLSLAVIGGTRWALGPEDFRSYGWRLPFLLSVLLLGVSLYVRLRMRESPLFEQLRAQGKLSRSPIRESFGNRTNLRYVLLALFGVTAGQGVVWYTAQFFAFTFLQRPLNLDWQLAYGLTAAALALGTPFFVVFGALSDRIGRRPLMIAGMALAALTFIPIYMGIHQLANPTLAASVSELSPAAMVGIVALITLQILFATMIYGPNAAFLVELFPTSIRYTSLSLPYHIGSGWFGGFLPLIATAATTSSWAPAVFGKYAIFCGLLYPIAISGMSAIVCTLFIRETKDQRIDGTSP